jgi:hypothetical protein
VDSDFIHLLVINSVIKSSSNPMIVDTNVFRYKDILQPMAVDFSVNNDFSGPNSEKNKHICYTCTVESVLLVKLLNTVEPR